MIDDQGTEVDVYFSQVSGEHTTYATRGADLHKEGEHAGKYTYFMVGGKFKKYF